MSFVFIPRKHKSGLGDNLKIVFLANRESTIFLDAVQKKLLEFLSGQF